MEKCYSEACQKGLKRKPKSVKTLSRTVLQPVHMKWSNAFAIDERAIARLEAFSQSVGSFQPLTGELPACSFLVSINTPVSSPSRYAISRVTSCWHVKSRLVQTRPGVLRSAYQTLCPEQKAVHRGRRGLWLQ